MIMMRKKSDWDTLDGVLDEVWVMLRKGVTNFRDPFHWPVLGTIGEDGPSLRSVILRKFILPDRILVCNTDSRATKARDIENDDRISWHFYHTRRKVQLRIVGNAKLHTDDNFADDQWNATRIPSRINYMTDQPPGTFVDKPSTGLSDFLQDKVPTLFDSEKGRKNFMSISCRIDSIDWLLLRVTGNRRARFTWEEDKMKANWIIP
jgi:pyridoxamine 5'-phosphate oxidase